MEHTEIVKYDLVKTYTERLPVKITSSVVAYDFIKDVYGGDLGVYETFYILCLNRANTVMGYAKIGQGGVSGVIVDMKILAKYAIASMANGIILVHNHPSGNLSPSDNDHDITEKVVKAMYLLDIKVLDHLILTESGYVSFMDSGFTSIQSLAKDTPYEFINEA